MIVRHVCIVTWYFATHKDYYRVFNFGNLEQRIMPEAVCDSRKSGVERNVLGRLLTLTYIHLLFLSCILIRNKVTWGERLNSRGTYPYLPDYGFQPRTTLDFNHYYFYVLFSHSHASTTRSPPGRWRSILASRPKFHHERWKK